MEEKAILPSYNSQSPAPVFGFAERLCLTWQGPWLLAEPGSSSSPPAEKVFFHWPQRGCTKILTLVLRFFKITQFLEFKFYDCPCEISWQTRTPLDNFYPFKPHTAPPPHSWHFLRITLLCMSLSFSHRQQGLEWGSGPPGSEGARTEYYRAWNSKHSPKHTQPEGELCTKVGSIFPTSGSCHSEQEIRLIYSAGLQRYLALAFSRIQRKYYTQPLHVFKLASKIFLCKFKCRWT